MEVSPIGFGFAVILLYKFSELFFNLGIWPGSSGLLLQEQTSFAEVHGMIGLENQFHIYFNNQSLCNSFP